MQVPQHCQMDQFEKTMALYSEMKIESNIIIEKGCQYLSKAEWKQLEKIGLGTCFLNSGKNAINDKGCRLICEGHWPQLKQVFIGTPLNSKKTVVRGKLGAGG